MLADVNLAAVWIAIGGAAILAMSVAGAARSTIPVGETRVFRIINGAPDWLYWPLWLPMQLGNLVVGTVVGLLVAWSLGSWGVAIGVILAMVLKLAIERLVRQKMAPYLKVRQRPGTSQHAAILRGADVPHEGPSFPSGHVILVAAVGTVLNSHLDPSVVWIPYAFAVLVALGRVYVGAHNPLDVLAGLGAGLAVGGAIAMLIR